VPSAPLSLDPHDRDRLERDGYLVLPGAIGPDLAEDLGRTVERLGQSRRVARRRSRDGDALFVEDPFRSAPSLGQLVDHPATLPAVVAMLGWNIYVYDAVAIITVPGSAQGGDQLRATSHGWHRDGGRMDHDTAGPNPPRLAAKVGFFLSDVSSPGMGNMEVVPGSHRWGSTPPPSASGAADGAVPVCGPPGTAVVFDRRLWHTAGVNESSQTRLAVMCGYGHRWIRPLQRTRFPRRWRRLEPVRRQLLGDPRPTYGRFFPEDTDVPLRAWAAERGIEPC